MTKTNAALIGVIIILVVVVMVGGGRWHESKLEWKNQRRVLIDSNERLKRAATHYADSLSKVNDALRDEVTRRENTLRQFIQTRNRENRNRINHRNEIIDSIHDTNVVDSFVAAMRRWRASDRRGIDTDGDTIGK